MGVVGRSVDNSLMAGLVGVAGMVAIIAPVQAQTEANQIYDLPAQDLSEALVSVGRTSGWEVIFSSAEVAGKRAPALKGQLPVQEAVRRLLQGTDLVAEFSERTVVVRGRVSTPAPIDPAPADEVQAIVVTGSRIRGGSPASPVITISDRDMAAAGHSNLGEAVRALPQNFGGGQNPGVALGVTGEDNINLGSGSSINLRGLGQDATLTLLNGRRLSYGSAYQAVDVSAIPLDAVGRIEVLVDGASAIYGSDAVAGVANVILKRDYDGVSASARFGAATDGGYVQQQYGIVGGSAWGSGGIIVGYNYDRNSAITARQRSYTSRLDDTTTLYPYQSHHAAIASGHQRFGAVELALDALYSRRATVTYFPFTTSASYAENGFSAPVTTEAFTIAPSVEVEVADDWLATAQFVYGEDRSRYQTLQWFAGDVYAAIEGCYCNSATSAELNAEGPLFDLGGGEVRLALGGGYRSNSMDYRRAIIDHASGAVSRRAFDVSRDSYYGFAELQLPFVSPDQDIEFIERLTASAAIRYEDYPGMASVATPKLGLVYAPSSDIDLKASWGRSFKAPTLYQQYVTRNAWLYAASGYGTGYPPAATTIFLGGGNEALEPERATSWSATLSIHPQAIDGLQIDVGYFDIDYRDRVVQPITASAGVLDNPAYRDLVTLDPTQGQIDAAIAYSQTGLQNFAGAPFDPANVVGIVDNRYLNVARQTARGLDAAASYTIDMAEAGTLSLQASGTYLTSRRQLSAGQPMTRVAGTIFNPPRFRGRAGAVWDKKDLSVAAWINHIGSVEDRRQDPDVTVDGQTTIDLTVRYATGNAGPIFGNMEFLLAVSNLFDEAPSIIATDYDYYAPYDSTNYSAIGRVVSLSITKRW